MLPRAVARLALCSAALGLMRSAATPLEASPSTVSASASSGSITVEKWTVGSQTPAQAASSKKSTAKSRTTPRRSARPSSRRRIVALPALRPSTPRGEIALAADLAALLRARVRQGSWGIVVASLSRGDTLFSLNPDAFMLPASTLKLYTTALAFDRLGPNHQLSTDIARDGIVGADGTLQGSLYLKGGGDPALSGRWVGGTADAPMRALARLVAGSGIKRVTGDVVGDASAFDAKRIPDGWRSRYLNDSYAARISALSLNENLLNVVIAPGKSGGAGIVTLQPATVAYNIVNSTRTSGSGRSSKLVVSRKGDGTVVARGTIGARSVPRVYQVVVEDPALFTAGAFRNALEREGIEIGGELRLGGTPSGASRVATFKSPPLWSLASAMNRESINHIAELLFRNAARTADPSGVGSAERGNLLLREFMTQKVGARWDAVNAADGSGLSTLDRVTPRSLVQLLGFANLSPWSREFHQSLPVAGESELLRHRMSATPAQGNLHAKTGTTNEVVALGGFVTTQNGELLAFSFLYNGSDRWNAKSTIDAMGATLAGFTR